MCFIDGETKRAHDLVRVVEAHAILSSDPIPVPLRFANELARLCELLIRCTGIHGGLDGLVGLCDGLASDALELEGVVANRLDACLQRLCTLIVALKAGLFRRRLFWMKAASISPTLPGGAFLTCAIR